MIVHRPIQIDLWIVRDLCEIPIAKFGMPLILLYYALANTNWQISCLVLLNAYCHILTVNLFLLNTNTKMSDAISDC